MNQNWVGHGALPQQIGSNLDFLYRLTDPIMQMQATAQYLAWLNEAMRQERILASEIEHQRNEQIKQQRALEEQALRAQLQLQAQAQQAQAQRTANLMQGISNVAAFFSEFLKDNPNIFKRPSRIPNRTTDGAQGPAAAPTAEAGEQKGHQRTTLRQRFPQLFPSREQNLFQPMPRTIEEFLDRNLWAYDRIKPRRKGGNLSPRLYGLGNLGRNNR